MRRKVQDGADCMVIENRADQAAVADVTDDQVRIEHGVAEPRAEIVEDHDTLAALDELADDVTADVAGTAGNEYGFHQAMVAGQRV
jgi:hypothetical protein